MEMNECLLHLWQHHKLQPPLRRCVCVCARMCMNLQAFYECCLFVVPLTSMCIPACQATISTLVKRSRNDHIMLSGLLSPHRPSATEYTGRDEKRKDLSHSKLSCFLKVTNLHYHWHFRNNELIIDSASSFSLEKPPFSFLDFACILNTQKKGPTQHLPKMIKPLILPQGKKEKKEEDLAAKTGQDQN